MDVKEFRGEFFCFSNFSLHTVVMIIEPLETRALVYRTGEHAYQCGKTTDPKEFKAIFMASTPAQAKKLGKPWVLKHMRSDWDKSFKYQHMLRIVCFKALQHPDVKKKLLDTGTGQLTEGNWWHDNYWGACNCPKCANKEKYNMLGKIWMMIRQFVIDNDL